MLVNQNIKVGGHRTSIRLEPEFWTALADIAQRERVTIDQLCTEIDRGAGKLSRTAAVRVFIVSYAVQLSKLADKHLELQLVKDVSSWLDAESVGGNSFAFQRHRVVG